MEEKRMRRVAIQLAITMRHSRKNDRGLRSTICITNVLILIIVLNMFLGQAMCLQYRYQICTAKDLIKSINEICMRHGKAQNSGLQMSPYGTIRSSTDVPDELLLEILKNARTHKSMRTNFIRRFRREQVDPSSASELGDYIDTCCQQSCVLYPENVAPYCSQI